jgi:hypothetical protein
MSDSVSFTNAPFILRFDLICKESNSTTKSWQHRKLTLLGKVIVIKTLALPKLIHLLTSLPNLKQSLFIDLNQFNLKSGQRI